MSHTELPWSCRLDDMLFAEPNIPIACCFHGVPPLDKATMKDNIEFIVKCVNAHDELVEALNLMLGLASGHIPGSDEFVDVITAKKILEKVKS